MSFNKFPAVKVNTPALCQTGWSAIEKTLEQAIQNQSVKTIVIECYQGVFVGDIIKFLKSNFSQAELVEAATALKTENEIRELTHSSVTDDRIFGFITHLSLADFFNAERVKQTRTAITRASTLTFVVGTGAYLLVEKADLVIYADMARWEIQLRMRKHEVANVGLLNYNDPFETQYKRGYFLDWRVCDVFKKSVLPKCDFVLDTNNRTTPKLITRTMFESGLAQAVKQPFSVVPFFDPGPWGGQWMKEKFDLDPTVSNYAWCFNCVPEENSLLFDFNGTVFETPSVNLVFFKPKELLGENIQRIFGDEFPIRFDFLDTVEGGKLSLQVHPLKEYIKNEFGMAYTQDESYYMLDATDSATVYLGLKENVDGKAMIADLKNAQTGNMMFDVDKYVQLWPAKKHDHFLIPAGTVHCSAEGCMVLEISATPYIFTFKLWDWGRLGLDGKPRPINIAHGEKVIQWDRQPAWTQENLINKFETLAEGNDWREERTGLHTSQFIETRRYWQSGSVTHQTNNGVNVLMVVEGDQAVVESPEKLFAPFVVNYAETFIVPANIKQYTIRPTGLSEGKEIAVIKASVRY